MVIIKNKRRRVDFIKLYGDYSILNERSMTGTSSDVLVSYRGHKFGGSYPSREIRAVYSAASTDWARPGLIAPIKILYRNQIHLFIFKGLLLLFVI